MPTTSVSDARRRCLRSLPCLVLSLSLAFELSALRSHTQLALRDTRQALLPLLARDRTIQALGQAEPPPPPLARTLIDALAVLRSGDLQRGVRVETLSLPGRGGALGEGPPDAQALARLAQPLPGAPGLRAVRVDVRASYRSYAGLQAWLAELSSLPLSFRRVWLEEQRVQLVLELAGT
jgi:hypothetical protein